MAELTPPVGRLQVTALITAKPASQKQELDKTWSANCFYFLSKRSISVPYISTVVLKRKVLPGVPHTLMAVALGGLSTLSHCTPSHTPLPLSGELRSNCSCVITGCGEQGEIAPFCGTATSTPEHKPSNPVEQTRPRLEVFPELQVVFPALPCLSSAR